MRIVLPLLLLGILALQSTALAANDSRPRPSRAPETDARKLDLDRDGRVSQAERSRAQRLENPRQASKSRPQAKRAKPGGRAATGNFGSAERQRLLQQRSSQKASSKATTRLGPPSTRAATSGARPAAKKGRT
jgi:hypothetical protein